MGIIPSITRYKQYIVSITTILLTALLCYWLNRYINYQMVALILLLAVSILAILYDIVPVLIAALLSALILNIFFLSPMLHYRIGTAENVLLFFIYLFIALVNAVLTHRIRKQERKVRGKEEKEKTIKLYDTLLNSLSHELKTPIATIIGSIDTLKQLQPIAHQDYQYILLTEMEIASTRLDQQVSNLLSMSRLETGNLRLKLDWCDVNELVFLVIQKFPGAHHRLVFVPDDALPLFKIDGGLIEQVLYGLLQNAMKYTPNDTTISLSVANPEDRLDIVVKDQGPGIPQEHLDLIFEKFHRVPHSKVGGSGLGLSIAKGFVEAHNGTIHVENDTDGGAKFSIFLPSETSYINNLKNE